MKPRHLPVTLKLLCVAALVLVLGHGASLYQLQRELNQQGQAQLQTLGEAISFQTALNAGPMLLSQDWLSLNIALKQLTDAPQVRGAEILDRQGKQLAQAGADSALQFQHAIDIQGDLLGSVRIYLDQTPLQRQTQASVRRTLLISALAALLGLAAFYGLSRHLRQPLQALNRAAEELRRDDTITPLDEKRRDEFGRIGRLLNRRFAPPLPEEELPLHEQLEHLADELRESLPPSAGDESPAAPVTGAPPAPLEPVVTAENEFTAPPAQQSLYLFYVDHRSAASDSLEAEERTRLLARYRQDLEQVALLYRGRLQEDEAGNWCVYFEPLSSEHSHGVNALCAAQLFNGLYRGINQQRIRNFSPVVNIKMALVMGVTDDPQGLAQRGSQMSQSLEANELITDAGLFSVPHLSERLLAEAGYRKTDEHAYLLTTLSPDYQALIDRQAEHFLNQNG
ncbi:AhpA/YtjB family protein [Motiliproteus sp. SC1-56]|uniref:AhpA/YtjB family protein n=1 Tax=Motiliproteus sp. SC1-56 TaxID=2799565 RepID=UPI001A8F9A8B|nr:AhpA/YtjB family protein [Motiliproteus sp. SC1-56]